jgi:hypothetical protein
MSSLPLGRNDGKYPYVKFLAAIYPPKSEQGTSEMIRGTGPNRQLFKPTIIANDNYFKRQLWSLQYV